MTYQGFIFDLNKCTGCHACQIACTLENQVEWGTNWRQVITFNEYKNPDLPSFHLSLACNHCMDAPCLKFCPALAITKDAQSGVVLISGLKCIGCKYCSWVCPFDAPRFNHQSGIMEKCTLCNHRLKENLTPACVSICPTNALLLGSFNNEIFNDPLEGFTSTGIRPAIKVIPLHPEQAKPEFTALPYTDDIIRQFETTSKSYGSKTSLLSEWSLLLFTFIIPILVGWILAHFISDVPVNLPIFSGLAIVAIVFSTMHLGHKFRAYRSIFNLPRSWLSREIFFFLLFMASSGFSLLFAKIPAVSACLAAISGICLLYSADRVYQVITRQKSQKYHSADLLISGLFYTTLFSGYKLLFILFSLVRMVLFILRENRFGGNTRWISLLSTGRIVMGLLLPVIFWIFAVNLLSWFILLMVFLSEGIDRLAFYLELSPITPGQQMKIDFDKKVLKTKRV